MKKKAKVHYNRDRVMSGRGPHKLFKTEIRERYLAKRKAEDEEKDVFDIDTKDWKGLKEPVRD